MWTKGNLTLTRALNARALGAFHKQALKRESKLAIDTLIEDLGDGHAINWSNVKEAKGQKLSEMQTTQMADGSERSLTTYFRNGREQDKEECVTTDLPGEQWLALIARPEMAMEIENLNRLALLVYDSDRTGVEELRRFQPSIRLGIKRIPHRPRGFVRRNSKDEGA